jgi:hypothetical protein
MRLPCSRSRRLLFLSVYLLFCWGLVFFGVKLFWMLHAGVPLHETARTVDFFYREIRQSGVQATRPQHDDDYFDVLLLDGSALDPVFGNAAECLAANLRTELGGRFRVFNLARQAHTSRDSLLKYSQLGGAQFELVVVYDGINDLRMNCCPRELFRDDYSHCTWYCEIQKLIDVDRMPSSASRADELKYVRSLIFLSSSVDKRMVEYGGEIKTDRTLRRNQAEIIRIAAARRDVVLLSTYAYDIPGDYTLERFTSGTLAYDDLNLNGRFPAESWGKPAHVVATLEAQNAAIRALAGENPDVLFVDQQELMPGQERLFYDVCHLSQAGSRRFVDNLWPAVARRLTSWKAARGAGF